MEKIGDSSDLEFPDFSELGGSQTYGDQRHLPTVSKTERSRKKSIFNVTNKTIQISEVIDLLTSDEDSATVASPKKLRQASVGRSRSASKSIKLLGRPLVTDINQMVEEAINKDPFKEHRPTDLQCKVRSFDNYLKLESELAEDTKEYKLPVIDQHIRDYIRTRLRTMQGRSFFQKNNELDKILAKVIN